jgi:hypothetical protein
VLRGIRTTPAAIRMRIADLRAGRAKRSAK